jgi:hypothetical protein
MFLKDLTTFFSGGGEGATTAILAFNVSVITVVYLTAF